MTNPTPPQPPVIGSGNYGPPPPPTGQFNPNITIDPSMVVGAGPSISTQPGAVPGPPPAPRRLTPQSVAQDYYSSGGAVHDAGDQQMPGFDGGLGFDPRELDDHFFNQGYTAWMGWRAAT